MCASGSSPAWVVRLISASVTRNSRGKDGVTTSELRELLESTITEAVSVIQNMQHHRLVEKISVQGRNPSVLEAIYVVVEHFGEHAGQIMYMTKQMTREDLGYYRHLSAQKSSR